MPRPNERPREGAAPPVRAWIAPAVAASSAALLMGPRSFAAALAVGLFWRALDLASRGRRPGGD